jgi:hypothetical protein
MLEAGTSRVRPMWSSIFFNFPNPSRRTPALGLTQSLTEMEIINIHGEQSPAGVYV